MASKTRTVRKPGKGLKPWLLMINSQSFTTFNSSVMMIIIR